MALLEVVAEVTTNSTNSGESLVRKTFSNVSSRFAVTVLHRFEASAKYFPQCSTIHGCLLRGENTKGPVSALPRQPLT